jgi:hypothetical protein
MENILPDDESELLTCFWGIVVAVSISDSETISWFCAFLIVI